MQLEEYLNKLFSSPEAIEFEHTIKVIEANCSYTPTAFYNGNIYNKAGENEGSCKIFSFAKMYELTESQTLACFGTYYRENVLKNPNGENHLNIRNFMNTGWAGIKFENDALEPV